MSHIMMLPRQLTISTSHTPLHFILIVCMGQARNVYIQAGRTKFCVMILLMCWIVQTWIQDDKTNGVSVRH